MSSISMSCIVISYKTNKKEHSKKLNCWFYYINSQKSKMKIALSKKANLPKFGQAQLQKKLGDMLFFWRFWATKTQSKLPPSHFSPRQKDSQLWALSGHFGHFWTFLGTAGTFGHSGPEIAQSCQTSKNSILNFFLAHPAYMTLSKNSDQWMR